MNIDDLKKMFLEHLQVKAKLKEPRNLYEPIVYILGLGGKRLRPLLAMISAEAFGENPAEALDVAVAIEVFHNFTLLHDDIMDDAPIRRGKATVHEKWDINTGILSGDVMLIHSYQYLENYDAETFKKLVQVFSKTAVEVCEGQQHDVDFETRDDVSMLEYLKMIEYKTSVLVAAALKMGAVVARASNEDQQRIYHFGIAMGMAFQLQDDYLDSFGEVATFGKQIGGDILENKKTWLHIKTLESANQEDQNLLRKKSGQKSSNKSKRIDLVKALYTKYKVDKLIKKEINKYSNTALGLLENLNIKVDQKQILKQLVLSLQKRNR